MALHCGTIATVGCAQSSRPFQMKLHELECFALRFFDLSTIASRQAMFGPGDFVKLKGDTVLLEFLRH
jgi:hypothetical protein